MFWVSVVDKLFLAYTVILFIRVFSSWLPDWNHTRFMSFIAYCSDPYLNLFRRWIPPLGMLDISPMIALFCLGVLRKWMISGIAAVIVSAR